MGWIRVDIMLPDPGRIVLVTCKTQKGVRSVNRAYVDEIGFWHGSGSMANVTAWMPMPDPYDEEE